MIYREMVDMYGKEAAETRGFNVYATAPSNSKVMHKMPFAITYTTMTNVMATAVLIINYGVPLAIYPKLVAKIEANAKRRHHR